MAAREPFVFGKGWVHSRDVLYFYGATDAMNEADMFESVVLRWMRGEWGLWQVPTRLCSVITADRDGERLIICTGIDGYVEVSDQAGVHVEAIDTADDGPSSLRHVTFVRPIGDRVFAVGMSRMAYVRDVGGGPWRRFDEGVRIPRQSLEIDGLKAIAGDERGRYVAVGLRGGIWLREDTRWRALDSPTNMKLEDVRWINGTLYVAGGGGLLLRGTPDALEVVEQTGTVDTIWSMAWFRGELYLATRRGSIWILRGDDIEPVELPGGEPVSTGWLHSKDDLLLSVGERDIVLFDGSEWRRLEPPPQNVDWPFEW